MYGHVDPDLAHAAAALGVAVDSFGWDDAAATAGFARGAVYLLRPDGHVALAMPHPEAAILRAYAARIGLASRGGQAPC